MLILLYLCYRKCKSRNALSRVGSSDTNQRLVTGVDMQQQTRSAVISSHPKSYNFRNTDVSTTDDDGMKNSAKSMPVNGKTDGEIQDYATSKLVY